MTRRLPALVLSLTLVVAGGACGGSDDDAAEPRQPAASGLVTAGVSSTLFDPEVTGDPSTTTAAGKGASTTTTTVIRGPAGRPAATSTTVSPAEARRAATAALDAYLDALAAEAYVDAMAASEDAPRALAYTRRLQQAFNRSRGGTSSARYTTRRFEAAAVTPDRVGFTGRAVLRVTTRQGEREAAATSELAEPVVVRSGEGWRVSALTFDGAPLTFHPSGQAAAHPSPGLELRLHGALDVGLTTVVLASLESDREMPVQLDADQLRRTSGPAAKATVRFLVGADAYFSYDRSDPPPASWQVRVAADGRTATLKLAFT